MTTYNTDRIALNFGIQALTLPTDYTFFLTFRLDGTKTGSGTFGMEAVKSVEGLLRDANTAETWSKTWEPDDTQGVAVDLSVVNHTITASWKGPVSAVAGDGTRDVEARVTSLPSTKK